jgi:hypothetical protein
VDRDILPGPPADLASRDVPVLEYGGILFRTHNIRRHPVYFGKAGLYRFDAPDGFYGVLYAGRDPSNPLYGVRALLRFSPDNGAHRALSELKPARPQRLIDLTQSGALLRIGADARLFSGPHPPCR